MNYGFHPHAGIFPLLDGEEFRALVEDIRANGQLDAIVLHDGLILDGRNRYTACLAAGVEPRFTDYDGDDPLKFVLSANLHRRHLTQSQRAALAVDLLPIYEEQAKERYSETVGRPQKSVAIMPPISTHGAEPVSEPAQSSSGHKAREDAATAVGVSPRYVQDAKAVATEDPELFAQVKAGEVTLPKAMRQVAQKRAAENPPPPLAGRYRVIYADPPWKYNDALAISNNGLGESYGPADAHYPQMTIRELCDLPVKDIAEDNAVLFVWVTSPLLEEVFSIIRAWGFTYKSSFVWDKVLHNMGHYNSVRHEFLLVCTRGSCTPDVKRLFDSVQSVQRTAHSEKPAEFRDIIDTIYPNGTRVELFARSRHDGWDAWGNQC